MSLKENFKLTKEKALSNRARFDAGAAWENLNLSNSFADLPMFDKTDANDGYKMEYIKKAHKPAMKGKNRAIQHQKTKTK
jgi:hypothetical protein